MSDTADRTPDPARRPEPPTTGGRPGAGRELRILVINWQDRLNPQAGGAEVHLHEIFGRLTERGHRVTLLVSGWEGAPRRAVVDGMEVVRAGRRYTFPLRVLPAYRRMDGRPFDVVVENLNKIPLFAPLWVESPLAVLVNHLFGKTAFREAPWPVAATVWSAERFIPVVYRRVPFHAVSWSTRADLVRRGLPGARIEVVHGGIDHERYGPAPDLERASVPTFSYVGRLKRYKGLDVLVSAMGILRERGIEARLVVAGTGDDRERLRRLVEARGLGDRIRLPGWISEDRKVALLRKVWANLYPSPKEGWGLTNIEAAACGTPTVASDAPGLRESVVDGETGFLVPHGDPEAWAERLALICVDEVTRRRLAQGARAHAFRFSWERAADATERSLRRIAAPGSSGR